MTSKFAELEKFECLKLLQKGTMELAWNLHKLEIDDYVCRVQILNGLSKPLIVFYQNVEITKELWDSLESNYMAENTSKRRIAVLEKKWTFQFHEDQEILNVTRKIMLYRVVVLWQLVIFVKILIGLRFLFQLKVEI